MFVCVFVCGLGGGGVLSPKGNGKVDLFGEKTMMVGLGRRGASFPVILSFRPSHVKGALDVGLSQ